MSSNLSRLKAVGSNSLVDEFKAFLLRGNVVDLAVAVVIGAAFTGVVNAVVENFITPLIGAIGGQPDFSALTFTINGSEFHYGLIINALISFLIVALVIFFFIVKPMNMLIARSRTEAPIDPTTKKCPYCINEVPIEATRCGFCTSDLAPEATATLA
jgi:large conductance mechanosensitive channel